MFPQHGDQHLVAGRVSELGAGLRLPAGEWDSNTLRQISGRLLSQPEFRQQAAKIADSFHAAGGYERAAEEILAFRG
jgi:UDP:flavonoid glycosyltransferase YjiC (YdhE family)